MNGKAKASRAPRDLDRSIGANIRAKRIECEMSQTDLADAIGVTFQQVQKYEKATNRVAASTLLAIADAFACPIAALLPALEGSRRSDGFAEVGEVVTRFMRLPPAARGRVLATVRDADKATD